jgi:hypothetical protein
MMDWHGEDMAADRAYADFQNVESKVDDEKARMAADLRQRMNRKAWLILALSSLGLGIPMGAAWLTLVMLLHLPALYACALAGAFLLLVALTSFGLVRLLQSRAQRAIALIGVADELGLVFKEVAAPGFAESLGKLEMFRTASGIAATNVLSGQVDGVALMMMDCIVAAGQATFESTVFVLGNVPARVPAFYLTPRDFLSRGSSGIEILKQPEFNSRFLLRGDDAQAVRRTFNAQVIEPCLAEKNQNIEVRHPLLAVMRRGGLLPPAQYQAFLLNCVRLVKALGVSGA